MSEVKVYMCQEKMAVSDTGSNTQWTVPLVGTKLPKSEFVFFVQVFLIYIVVITSIVNLTINGDEGKLWTALLSSSLGYLLPNPSLKARVSNHD